jgi:ankyrin repeat protein
MNYENIVRMLLDAGGNVDIRNHSDGTGYVGETALHRAAFWGRYEIGKLLIDAGAEVDALTKTKSTPLHSAARRGNVRFARLLLENGARADAQDEDGKTPLDWCSERNGANAPEIEKLLRKYVSNTAP